MDNHYAIDLDNIFLIRGETPVFTSFSWQVKKGEHWFVMGNNGCGKTSLLEIIMGYLWPQQGTVRILGEAYGQTYIQRVRTHVGYVSPWIFRRMGADVPVYKAVASGVDASTGLWTEVPDDLYEKAVAKLEFFGCAQLAQRLFGELSSGQQFKVILSRALINDPALLLLDEPYSQLDIGARMKAHDLVERLVSVHNPPTVILVTHHLEDITASYTHGLLFKDRNTRLAGTRERVLTNAVFRDMFGIAKDVF